MAPLERAAHPGLRTRTPVLSSRRTSHDRHGSTLGTSPRAGRLTMGLEHPRRDHRDERVITAAIPSSPEWPYVMTLIGLPPSQPSMTAMMPV
jgi:hypothetical protein